MIDDSSDGKASTKTAHVARQSLASMGKIRNGVVAVTGLWADERIYYPLHVRRYTPAERQGHPHLPHKPTGGPAGRGGGRGRRPVRVVVADCFYCENTTLKDALKDASFPYVLVLKPSSGIWAPARPPHVGGGRPEAGIERPPEPGRLDAGRTVLPRWARTDLVGGRAQLRALGADKAVRWWPPPPTQPPCRPLTTSYLATTLPRPVAGQPRSWVTSAEPDSSQRTQIVALHIGPTDGATALDLDELGPVTPLTFPLAPGRSADGHRIKATLEYGRGPTRSRC